MKRLLNRIFVTSGLVLAASAVGLLTGVRRLIRPKSYPAASHRAFNALLSAGPVPEPVAEAPVEEPESLKADRHFSIKRTKSEVGYVYWILEGYGKYKCFVLCDSWDEAVAQAKARLAADENESSISAEFSVAGAAN